MSKRTRTRHGHGNPTKERERRQQRTPKKWRQEFRACEDVRDGEMAVIRGYERHRRAGMIVARVGMSLA